MLEGTELLSEPEKKAIKALRKLAKKFPSTLLIYCGSCGMSIRKPSAFNNKNGAESEVDNILGFWVDGGDGGDNF